MHYVILNDQSLKYIKFTPSDCNDIGIRKFEFVAGIAGLTLRPCSFFSEKTTVSSYISEIKNKNMLDNLISSGKEEVLCNKSMNDSNLT